ncbi:MAG: hypothetical protein WBW71_02335 [Bacteroidota bacterium]
MKSRYAFSIKFFLILILAFATFSCNGWEYRNEKKTKRIVLGANEVHEGWYFAAGDQVVIDGTVNGDAYVAGGVVDVEGTINGDLLVAGGMVTVGGTVSDHIRAAGGTININGKVGKDISAVGGSIIVGRSGDVSGNLLAACGNLEILGNVGKEARMTSGDAQINGTIKGDLNFIGNYLTVGQGANVGGNLHAMVKDKEKINIADGAVHGKVEIEQREKHARAEILGYSVWGFWMKIIWFFGLLFVGLLMVLVVPARLRSMGTTIIGRFGEVAVWGILGMIVIPVLSGICFVTLIGIPVGLFLMTLFLWLLYFSQFALALVIAETAFVLEGKGRLVFFGALAAGLVIVEVLTFIPYVTILVCLANFILGVGAMLLMLKGGWGEMKKA